LRRPRVRRGSFELSILSFCTFFCPDISTTGRARAVPEPRPIEAPSRRRIVFSSF
jgi:hypothetical protein